MTALSHLYAFLPMATSAALVSVQMVRAGRRRSALNRAVHELRRPLQAIALAGSGPRALNPTAISGSVGLLAAALERLDGEINGCVPAPLRKRLPAELLARSAVARWRSRAALAGGSLTIGWYAGQIVIDGDAAAISQALDNLIVNAIEHGGPAIAVEGRLRAERLLLTVSDSGRGSRPSSRRRSPAEAIARLTGRRRHGHGLVVVREVAVAHGGRFVLRRSDRGSVAALELPLSGEARAAA